MFDVTGKPWLSSHRLSSFQSTCDTAPGKMSTGSGDLAFGSSFEQVCHSRIRPCSCALWLFMPEARRSQSNFCQACWIFLSLEPRSLHFLHSRWVMLTRQPWCSLPCCSSMCNPCLAPLCACTLTHAMKSFSKSRADLSNQQMDSSSSLRRPRLMIQIRLPPTRFIKLRALEDFSHTLTAFSAIDCSRSNVCQQNACCIPLHGLSGPSCSPKLW